MFNAHSTNRHLSPIFSAGTAYATELCRAGVQCCVPRKTCVICVLHNAQHQTGLALQGLPGSDAIQMPLQPSSCTWLVAALQVLAVSTHNHYRRVQDRMRKKQQQEARETAAANAGKMQAPAGPSGQAQVGCTSHVATGRRVAGLMSTVVQYLAGELNMLHHTAAGRCQAAACCCGSFAASSQLPSSAALLQIASGRSSHAFCVVLPQHPVCCRQATWWGFAHHWSVSCKSSQPAQFPSCC